MDYLIYIKIPTKLLDSYDYLLKVERELKKSVMHLENTTFDGYDYNEGEVYFYANSTSPKKVYFVVHKLFKLIQPIVSHYQFVYKSAEMNSFEELSQRR